MYKLLILIIILLLFVTLATGGITYYSTTYYPPLNGLPIWYPLDLIDSSYTPGLFQQQQYVEIDPVNAATPQGTSPVCTQNKIPAQFTLDSQGHCFAACTDTVINDPSQPTAYRNIRQIFCQSLAENYPASYSDVLQSRISQPQFYMINCTSSTLPANWQYNNPPNYDAYALSKADSSSIPALSSTPVCFGSEMCFQSIGLPKTVFDGPSPSIIQSTQPFYCCRTATGGTSIYNVTYNYNCVASIYDTVLTTQVAKQVSCTRQITVTNNPSNTNPEFPILMWDTNSYSCSIQCVYPYVTSHVGVQDYEPQPYSQGCSPGDYSNLCTLNLVTNQNDICSNPGEQLVGLIHYQLSQINSTGTFDILPAGPIAPSTNLEELFLARTWKTCSPGDLNCVPYCHCWNGCPNHPQCSSSGTNWESPNLGVTSTCMCNPGMYGNNCEHQEPYLLCNTSPRINVQANSDYCNL